MKRLSFSLLVLASAWLASCEVPSDSSTSVTRPDPSSNGHGGGTSAAPNPALTYIGSVSSHGHVYQTISVMDSGLGNQTAIYGAGLNTANYYWGPTWSPTNASIAFIQNGSPGNVNTNELIRAVDVTVSATSVSGTNARTIYTLPSNEADNGGGPTWSNTSTTNLIAFSTRSLSGSKRTTWVVSASGGTPVKVWETDSSMVKEDGSILGHIAPLGYTTWSSDDSRLAIMRYDSGAATTYATAGNHAVTIMIFTTTDNGATWNYTDSLKRVSTAANAYYQDMQWSRSGQNTLALWWNADGKLYYSSPTTGATLTTNDAVAGGLSWSPDNSSILTCSSTSIWKTTPFTSTTTTVGSNPSYAGRQLIRWKH